MNDHRADPELDQSGTVEYVPEDDRVIGTAFRWSLIVFAIVAVVMAVIYLVTRESEVAPVIFDRPPTVAPDPLRQETERVPDVRFVDLTSEAGINFIHESGATGLKLLPETMGGGCAFFDYDNDGDQDLLLVNSSEWPAADDGESSNPVRRTGVPATTALYRNDGGGTFTDVSAEVGLNISFYGMGAAVGDYDNDGDVDLFLTSLHGTRLFRNDRETFTEVTDFAGVAGDPNQWSTSAGFFDYDNDGLLDLFVCNYVKWSREIDLALNFTLNGRDRAYGPPKSYVGVNNYLYHNNGDGTFTDVSETAGIHKANPATGEPMGKALAVTFIDVDKNGYLDIFVANDTVENFLYQNIGDGTFKERGQASGVAVDNAGFSTGAMGMDAALVENDDRIAVGIGNFANESTSFYVQQAAGNWGFSDESNAQGIGSPSRLRLSFGLFFFDYDLDGRLDMLQANGHLEDEINEIQPSQHYLQPTQLFWNCGPDARVCFTAVAEERTGDLGREIVGRGAAYADIDGDGDQDVLITQTGGPPLLLRNDQKLEHNWVRIKLRGTRSNRDAIGAWVEVVSGGVTQRRQVMPTRSYLSQVELPVTFGLADADTIDSARVFWPDGTEQTIDELQMNVLNVVTQSGDAS